MKDKIPNDVKPLLPAVTRQRLIDIICGCADGIWRKGPDKILMADEVDVERLADELIDLLSSTGG